MMSQETDIEKSEYAIEKAKWITSVYFNPESPESHHEIKLQFVLMQHELVAVFTYECFVNDIPQSGEKIVLEEHDLTFIVESIEYRRKKGSLEGRKVEGDFWVFVDIVARDPIVMEDHLTMMMIELGGTIDINNVRDEYQEHCETLCERQKLNTLTIPEQ